MNETIQLAALIAASSGAILSTISGWWNAPPEVGFKKGKLASSLIIAVFGAFALINFDIIQDQLTNIGLVGLVSTYLMLGFGVDQSLSKLDRG